MRWLFVGWSLPTRWAFRAEAICYLLLVLLSVPCYLKPAACRQLIRGRHLREAQGSATVDDTGYFPPDAATAGQTWDTVPAATQPAITTVAAVSIPTVGSSSSSGSTAAGTQPYSYTGATLAANTNTRTYRHPCSYADVCKHYGRCVPYGWTFACNCPEGWGGWYCEKPVAARSTALATIPSVPRLAPQPSYRRSSATQGFIAPTATTTTYRYSTEPSSGWVIPTGVISDVPVASVASSQQLVSGTGSSTADGLASSDSVPYVHNSAVQQNTSAGTSVAADTWSLRAAAAVASGRPGSYTSDVATGVVAGYTVLRTDDVASRPQVHAMGEDPRLDSTDVTNDDNGSSNTSTFAGVADGSAGTAAADVAPFIIGVVAPVG